MAKAKAKTTTIDPAKLRQRMSVAVEKLIEALDRLDDPEAEIDELELLEKDEADDEYCVSEDEGCESERAL